MNSFVFDKRVKAVIVSYKSSREFFNLVENLKIDIIKTKRLGILEEQVNDHPDMVIHPIDFKNFIVYKDLHNYYLQKLRRYNINIISSINSIKNEYPYDIYLNISRVGNYFFHKKNHIDIRANEYLSISNKPIEVKQGYAKCSTMIIKEETVITTDISLHKKYKNLGLKSYLLPPGNIDLPGYNTGFIGGTCGNIGKEELLFYGNIEKYEYFEELKKILEKENISFYYPRIDSFVDRGSIIGILGG